MRGRRSLLVGLAAVAAASVAVLAGDEGKARDGRLVVHEWGTFTSMQGADGVALEGLSREEEALPEFVYSRAKVRACPLRDKGWKGLEVPADHVTQKMETPVLYFRSDTARKARVRVDFLKGLISQWYPVSDLLGPPEGDRAAGPLDVSKVDRSFLQWDVDVLPLGAAEPTGVPRVERTDPWSFAREVEASWIRTLPRTAAGRAGPVEAERYLFYRGLGHFPMPLSTTALGDGVFILENSGAAPLESPVLLEVANGRARIGEVASVPAAGTRKASLRGDAWEPIEDIVGKIQALLHQRLVAAGLAADEARAMIRTWSRSWFRCEGTRVLWTLPRPSVDALLPLSIDPAPDELVRVLVGRMEVITPEVEERDYASLGDALSKDAAVSARGVAALQGHGRFLEPHLRRVIAVIDARGSAPRARDAEIRGEAASCLGKLVAAGE